MEEVEIKSVVTLEEVIEIQELWKMPTSVRRLDYIVDIIEQHKRSLKRGSSPVKFL